MSDKSTPQKVKAGNPWGSPKSPWSSPSYAATITPNFSEIMNEEFAIQVQEKEISAQPRSTEDIAAIKNLLKEDSKAHEDLDESIKTDELIARALQEEELAKYKSENHRLSESFERNCKVQMVSGKGYSNFANNLIYQSDEEDDEFVFVTDTKNEDPSENMLDFKGKDYVKFGNKIVTKHDAEINGRRNTSKFEDSVPLGIDTGDLIGMDFRIDNKNYNKLKKDCNKAQKKQYKVRDKKDQSSAEHALDEGTIKILNRCVDRGFIGERHGVVNIGKEAIILHADKGCGLQASTAEDAQISKGNKNDNSEYIMPENLPDEFAIKVHKTTLAEYKHRLEYIKNDYRFGERVKNMNDRKFVHQWAEKEMHNLIRMHQNGIPCPEVVLVKKHVILMSFIGKNSIPAPQLRQAKLSTKNQQKAYQQTIDLMKDLFQKCNLVHGDLSEYNLLWFQNKIYVIDVSQSVEPTHPSAMHMLWRDCNNIHKFFTKLNVSEVMTPMHLFNYVSGYEIPTDDETEFKLRWEEIKNDNVEHANKRRNCSSKLLQENEDNYPVNHC